MKNSFEPAEQFLGKRGQRLIGGHKIQIGVDMNVEKPKHLVNHFAMLGRQDDPKIKRGIPLKRTDDRRELQGFRASSEENDDSWFRMSFS